MFKKTLLGSLMMLAISATTISTAMAGDYTPVFGAGLTPEQVEKLPVDLYRQGLEYYGNTHFHPNSQTNSTVASLQD